MIGRGSTAGVLAVLATLLACLPVDAAKQELVTLATRPGVSMKLLVMSPDATPSGVFVMFPGGDGKGHFGQGPDGIWRGTNFLVRSAALFVDEGFGVAIVDVPSDHAAGMSDEFRTSREHTADVQKVVDLLGGKPPAPVFLIGTSGGTISAAHLGVTLKDPRVAGVVLTASIGASRRSGFSRSLFDLPLEAIMRPVLFVHHRKDACWASRFDDAVKLAHRTTGSSKNGFIEVVGGDSPRSEPCEALSAHGFLGTERGVVKAIADWAGGKPVPAQVGSP